MTPTEGLLEEEMLGLETCMSTGDGIDQANRILWEVVKLGKINWAYPCSFQNRFIAATLVSSRSIHRLSWNYTHLSLGWSSCVIENVSLCHHKIGKSTTVVDLHCSFIDVGQLLRTCILVVWSSLLQWFSSNLICEASWIWATEQERENANPGPTWIRDASTISIVSARMSMGDRSNWPNLHLVRSSHFDFFFFIDAGLRMLTSKSNHCAA